jgi:hypothetical protein
MRVSPGAILLLTATVSLLMAQTPPKTSAAAKKTVPADPKPDPVVKTPVRFVDRLTYDVEWRLIHAGAVVIEAQPEHADLKLDSAGMVSSLFKVHDVYSVNFDDGFCATAANMESEEGKRHHLTKITFDRAANRATYLERDLLRDAVLHSDSVAIPNCVQDVVGAFLKLRHASLGPGQSMQIPMSDGRRSASVRIDAQEREEVKTPSGDFKTIRYEGNMMNGVIYTRKGRVFIWLTDDERRMPVQIRLRLQFPVGTVTLQLEKEEHPQ